MPRVPCLSPVVLAAAMACLGPLPGWGQTERPSINCGAASGVVTAMVCSDAEIGASNTRVSGHVDTVVQTLEDEGEEGAEALSEFQTRQEEWTAKRDACNRSSDPRACVADAYAAREAELVTTFQLQEPTSQTSFTCPGGDVGGLSIAFFDLDLPAVRIEGAADDALTGTATTTVDGSKYALSSGQEVWVRKDVARFTNADGTSVTCLIED